MSDCGTRHDLSCIDRIHVPQRLRYDLAFSILTNPIRRLGILADRSFHKLLDVLIVITSSRLGFRIQRLILVIVKPQQSLFYQCDIRFAWFRLASTCSWVFSTFCVDATDWMIATIIEVLAVLFVRGLGVVAAVAKRLQIRFVVLQLFEASHWQNLIDSDS